MTAVPLFASVRKREIARLPYCHILNMLVEPDPSNQVDGLVRIQRPGLAAFRLLPEGPCRGINRIDDALGGYWFTVNGTHAYRVEFNGSAHDQLGSLPGTDAVQIAIGRDRVLFAGNGNAYAWNGSVWSTIVMPGAEPVGGVAFINGYFVITVAGSDRFYWIAPGEVDPDPLSYATAERQADNLLGPFTLGDELWLFGGDSIEVWFPTTDADAPFQRANSRVYEKGGISRDAIVMADNTLWAIGADRVVYRFTPTPQRVSDYAIEEQLRLANSNSVSLWSLSHNGHTVVVVQIPDQGTWGYDVSTGLWSQFSSYGQEDWRVSTGFTSEDKTLCGDDTSGQLWVLDATISTDGNSVFTRDITGMVEVVGRPVRCDSFSIRCASGWSPTPVLEPKLRVRWSDDQGATWSDWELLSLGMMGQYAGEPTLRQLGLIDAPGRIFWLRMTDDAVFRINYARMNEAWGA